jgi:hypothetical protein
MRFLLSLRVIRNVDLPQISFTYELRDQSGGVLQSGAEELSGMHNFRLTMRVNDNSALNHEKAMSAPGSIAASPADSCWLDITAR